MKPPPLRSPPEMWGLGRMRRPMSTSSGNPINGSDLPPAALSQQIRSQSLLQQLTCGPFQYRWTPLGVRDICWSGKTDLQRCTDASVSVSKHNSVKGFDSRTSRLSEKGAVELQWRLDCCIVCCRAAVEIGGLRLEHGSLHSATTFSTTKHHLIVNRHACEFECHRLIPLRLP